MASLLEKKSFFNLFPVPEYLLLSTSGVAICDDSIKFVQFRRGMFGGHIQLANMAKVVTPEHSIEAGVINDQTKLSASLKELSDRYNIRYARATLPEEKAYLFSAAIDRVSYEGMRDAVAFILEENVPLSLADAVFDFDVIDDVAESSQIKVTVSVLPKMVVDAYIEVFEKAGITPISFDIESQAITRSIVPAGDKSAQLILNLNNSKTGFYVVSDGVVQFTTTLPYGTGDQAPYAHMSELVMEMRKIFGFWNSKPNKDGTRSKQIEKVLVCGGGANNSEFVEELMKDCTVSFALANPWVNTPVTIKDLPKITVTESLEYVSAIGLPLPKKQ